MSDEVADPFRVLSRLASSWNPSTKFRVWPEAFDSWEAAALAVNRRCYTMMHQDFHIVRESEILAKVEEFEPREELRSGFRWPEG